MSHALYTFLINPGPLDPYEEVEDKELENAVRSEFAGFADTRLDENNWFELCAILTQGGRCISLVGEDRGWTTERVADPAEEWWRWWRTAIQCVLNESRTFDYPWMSLGKKTEDADKSPERVRMDYLMEGDPTFQELAEHAFCGITKSVGVHAVSLHKNLNEMLGHLPPTDREALATELAGLRYKAGFGHYDLQRLATMVYCMCTCRVFPFTDSTEANAYNYRAFDLRSEDDSDNLFDPADVLVVADIHT